MFKHIYIFHIVLLAFFFNAKFCIAVIAKRFWRFSSKENASIISRNPIYFDSELKAEKLRLRTIYETIQNEKQLGIAGVTPRRLLDCFEPVQSDEVKRKQKEIDKLKEQLKKTEEQLTATQM